MAVDPAPQAQPLTSQERERYRRQLVLKEIGEDGQLRLKRARVAVVGAGGLGSPAALYLAAAGVGTLGLFDPDAVELSNLQRQLLHSTDRLNPGVAVVAVRERLTGANALSLLSGWDVIVTAVDNFPTRYLINDACVGLGTPNVDGSVCGLQGQLTVWAPGRGPCYRCLFPEPPPPELAPPNAEAGVLGVVPGVIGVLQASEVIKLLLGKGEPLIGRLLTFDALGTVFRCLKIQRDPACPVCGDGVGSAGG